MTCCDLTHKVSRDLWHKYWFQSTETKHWWRKKDAGWFTEDLPKEPGGEVWSALWDPRREAAAWRLPWARETALIPPPHLTVSSGYEGQHTEPVSVAISAKTRRPMAGRGRQIRGRGGTHPYGYAGTQTTWDGTAQGEEASADGGAQLSSGW